MPLETPPIDSPEDHEKVDGDAEDLPKIESDEQYGELFEEYRTRIRASVLSRLKNVHLTEELMQEIWMHGLQTYHQVRDARKFLSWIMIMARNMCINKSMRNKPTAPLEISPNGDAVSNRPAPHVRAERRETRVSLKAALDLLKPLDRQTLVAFHLKHKNLKQMSKLFDVPVGTIKRRLHVARNRLKAVIQSHWEFESIDLNL